MKKLIMVILFFLFLVPLFGEGNHPGEWIDEEFEVTIVRKQKCQWNAYDLEGFPGVYNAVIVRLESGALIETRILKAKCTRLIIGEKIIITQAVRKHYGWVVLAFRNKKKQNTEEIESIQDRLEDIEIILDNIQENL